MSAVQRAPRRRAPAVTSIRVPRRRNLRAAFSRISSKFTHPGGAESTNYGLKTSLSTVWSQRPRSRSLGPVYRGKEKPEHNIWCESCIVCVARRTPICGHLYHLWEGRRATTQQVVSQDLHQESQNSPQESQNSQRIRKTVARRIATAPAPARPERATSPVCVTAGL